MATACGTRLTPLFPSGSPNVLMKLPMLSSGNYSLARLNRFRYRTRRCQCQQRLFFASARKTFDIPGKRTRLSSVLYNERTVWEERIQMRKFLSHHQFMWLMAILLLAD